MRILNITVIIIIFIIINSIYVIKNIIIKGADLRIVFGRRYGLIGRNGKYYYL